jgi:protein gp37
MSDKSNIEWTDATWNPVRGCVKISPGCAHCYAETFAERFRGVPGHPYEQGFDLRLVPHKLTEPLTWKKPRRVFVNSMSDLFQDGVPETFVQDVFKVIQACPQHTFQVLTKRADRMRDVVSSVGRTVIDQGGHWPLPNVWLGVSVENQVFAVERIPLLLQTPAAIRFISAEPLLAPVDLAAWLQVETGGNAAGQTRLDWVIVGGESGHGARPFDVKWARAITGQCGAAGVPCFVKQFGANPCTSAGVAGGAATLKIELQSSKGGDIAEWPADLRVRQFPEIRP